MRKFIIVALLACSACSKGIIVSPTVDQSEQVENGGSGGYRTLSTIVGSTWTGTSTTNNSTTGHSGSASVTFTAGGPAGDVAATIAWTLNGSAVVFNGSAAGTPAAIVLSAPAAQTHGCANYAAQGTISGNTFSGTYSATCHHAADAVQGDAGTFSLTRIEAPVDPPVPPVDPNVTFCHVPPGNPANAQTLSLPLTAINNGHIPNHPLDHLGVCTGKEGQ